MFESDDIINYIYDTYGPGADKVPFTLKGSFATVTSTYAALVRGMAGARVPPDGVWRPAPDGPVIASPRACLQT